MKDISATIVSISLRRCWTTHPTNCAIIPHFVSSSKGVLVLHPFTANDSNETRCRMAIFSALWLLCHPAAFRSWLANWNHELFSPAFLALPIGTYYRFSPAFRNLQGFHQHFSTANCTAAVQHCWQTAFKLMVLLRWAVGENFNLHFLISEFRFGPRFVRRTISTLPPRVSARFDWFHLAQNNNGSCIFSAFIILLIKFKGSVVREQNHRSTGSCLFTASEPHHLYSHYYPRLGWIQVLCSSDVLT